METKRTTALASADVGELATWFEEQHGPHRELWVRIFKVGSGVPSVTWVDCVVGAIRFGWIDGQRQSFDGLSFAQRFTPRKPGSNGSAKNREHVARLEAESRMTLPGMAHVQAARADGRWDAAYASSATMVMPEDLLAELDARPAAKAFFATFDRMNLYPKMINDRNSTPTRPCHEHGNRGHHA